MGWRQKVPSVCLLILQLCPVDWPGCLSGEPLTPGQALLGPSLDTVFLGELGDVCRDVGEQGATELPVTPPGEAISENQLRSVGWAWPFFP